VADGFDGGRKARAEGGEVKRTGTLVNLNGIAAAQGDVGLGSPFEVREFAAGARAASGIARNFQGLEAAGPDVGGNEPIVKRFVFSSEKL